MSIEFTRKDDKGRETQTAGMYLASGVFTFLFLVVIVWLFPWSIEPFTLFQFWNKTDIMGGICASWPIFVWAALVTTFAAALTNNKHCDNQNAEDHLVTGFAVSVFAGVTEEIIFRWIIFLDSIIAVKVANWLFFGWLGFGLPEWFFSNLCGPVASFFTYGKMDWLLFEYGSWAIGAACLAAAAKFRAGHAYLGLLGFINSWYIGMFLFWIMFQYGLLAAIVVHFLYDLIIFVIGYVDRVQERARGVGTFG